MVLCTAARLHGLRYYVHRVFGILHDDYNYGGVNLAAQPMTAQDRSAG